MSDITYRDTLNYINILYKDNGRKWICRLVLNDGQKSILIPDENKVPVKHTITDIYDIRNFKSELENVLERYKMEVCDLGIEWFTAVQHGSNLRKGENTVEFKTLFPILKKYLADDADVPYFFRELMAMVTTVTEEEWGSSKDPSTKTKDETLRTYAKRGISQKLVEIAVSYGLRWLVFQGSTE